ncbi:Uncharacterised protein [Klebsiella pneumoniae]|uniref:hypothetical protein n=2 Tax=Klebsiella pneumoniae TaxID=573 RepID=UPI000E2A4AA8|nr:hypothetical protein [Klebsiella pneumoniae]SYS26084.1 Uncharacterised protein [Klebsiella pneumoniae]
MPVHDPSSESFDWETIFESSDRCGKTVARTYLFGQRRTSQVSYYNMSAHNVIRDYVKNDPAIITPQGHLLHNPHYAQLHYAKTIFRWSIFFEDRSWSKKHIAQIANPDKKHFYIIINLAKSAFLPTTAHHFLFFILNSAVIYSLFPHYSTLVPRYSTSKSRLIHGN